MTNNAKTSKIHDAASENLKNPLDLQTDIPTDDYTNSLEHTTKLWLVKIITKTCYNLENEFISIKRHCKCVHFTKAVNLST